MQFLATAATFFFSVCGNRGHGALRCDVDDVLSRKGDVHPGIFFNFIRARRNRDDARR